MLAPGWRRMKGASARGHDGAPRDRRQPTALAAALRAALGRGALRGAVILAALVLAHEPIGAQALDQERATIRACEQAGARARLQHRRPQARRTVQLRAAALVAAFDARRAREAGCALTA
jgi:hypothetical protein